MARLCKLPEVIITIHPRNCPEETVQSNDDAHVAMWQNDRADPKLVMELGQGQYFGERALLTNEPRAANVIACGERKNGCKRDGHHLPASSCPYHLRALVESRTPPLHLKPSASFQDQPR